MKVKAITLWQPWATLWLLRIKQNETRPRQTKHRGPLIVHAGKAIKPEGEGLWNTLWETDGELMLRCHKAGLIPLSFNALPFGQLLGAVHVLDAKPITGWTRLKLPSLERMLGNYTDGRWMWIAKSKWRLIFKQPVPARGHQGFFDVDVPPALFVR